MDDTFRHDVFLSGSIADLKAMKELRDELRGCGLRVYLADEPMRVDQANKDHVSEVLKSLDACRHLVVFASEESAKSEWVEKECNYFFERCHLHDKSNRHMLAVSSNRERDKNKFIPRVMIPAHALTHGEVVSKLVTDAMTRVKASLDDQEARVREAFDKYDYSRLWRREWGATKNGIHIFTCARDLSMKDAGRGAAMPGSDPNSPRPRGGRTNIDIWDFQTVLDLTRFFASAYSKVHVTIEDPVSKLSSKIINDEPTVLADRMAEMRDKLKNTDCVIVGSPDVSDYAELVWAKLHNIGPYQKKRVKQRGFVIIKGEQRSSSVYWAKEDREDEGIAKIEKGKVVTTYMTEPRDGFETSYGVLVVANNPFDDADKEEEEKSRILILSGFTGVATNGIARLIADPKFRNQFYELDRAFVDRSMQFEALVSVTYGYSDANIDARDARVINEESDDAVCFKEMVSIPYASKGRHSKPRPQRQVI